MKANECPVDPGPFRFPYSATNAVEPADHGPEVDRPVNNGVVKAVDLPGGSRAASVATYQRFPFRTLMVCFTIWLIATQAMIFDQVKFDERAHLLEQAARSLGGPQVVVPNEPPPNRPSGVELQRL